MKHVTFLYSATIHAADDSLRPLCCQTDAEKQQRVQSVIATGPTCGRCVTLLELRDKNSPAARTRRRFAAARQALCDGRQGACQFEKRTTDPRARESFAGVLRDEINKLTSVIDKLEQTHAPAHHSTTPTTQPA